MNTKPAINELGLKLNGRNGHILAPEALELGVRHQPNCAPEGTDDIGRIARSIGFTAREVKEIERRYRSKLRGRVK